MKRLEKGKKECEREKKEIATFKDNFLFPFLFLLHFFSLVSMKGLKPMKEWRVFCEEGWGEGGKDSPFLLRRRKAKSL
jgi:hypothetical protein